MQWFCYLALLVLVVGLVARILRYARAPVHLRWELYPVAHEVDRPYGGSYYEEPDWWTKPRKTSLLGEVRVMFSEIFFHAALWHHNRKMWVVSYPFHLGIYLVAVFLLLLVVGGVAQVEGLPVAPGNGWAASLLYHLTVLTGVVGTVLAALGGVGVLARRVGDPGLRACSAPSDYFNAGLIVLTALTWFLTWLFVDPSFGMAREFAGAVFTFSSPAGTHPAVLAEMALLGVFLMYLPFTHMTHFVGKWFTYHTVRWDDRPNLGGAYEKDLARMLNRPVGWSAPHINRGTGTRTWAEVTGEVE